MRITVVLVALAFAALAAAGYAPPPPPQAPALVVDDTGPLPPVWRGYYHLMMGEIDDPFRDPAPHFSPVSLPEGSEPMDGTEWTQSLFSLNGFRQVSKTPRAALDPKWRFPGGLAGVRGWTSQKFRHVPSPPAQWLGAVRVTNPLGVPQTEFGLVRSYPDGTRFDDILSSPSGVFEHRVRRKEGGSWQSFVAFRDESKAPPGYKKLAESCSSCHDQAGTGSYGQGLVPGGDTVISDELPWHLVGG